MTGRQTIAEYVTDQEILKNLKQIGVDFAQGYWVGEPRLLVALDDVLILIAQCNKINYLCPRANTLMEFFDAPPFMLFFRRALQ